MTAVLIVLMARYYAPLFRIPGRVILANSLLAAWRSYRRRSGLGREVITLALGIVAGLLLLPVAIYVVGRMLLGPYLRDTTDVTADGPIALWTDYLAGLSAGSLAHWLVLLGPYGAYLIWRIGRNSRRT